MDASLRIETAEREGSLVIAVEGELDIVSSPLLDEALVRARATGATRIVVDLLNISFIDSTAVHVLIKHSRAEDDRAPISLIEGSEQTRRLFRLSGASEYLSFVSAPPGPSGGGAEPPAVAELHRICDGLRQTSFNPVSGMQNRMP